MRQEVLMPEVLEQRFSDALTRRATALGLDPLSQEFDVHRDLVIAEVMQEYLGDKFVVTGKRGKRGTSITVMVNKRRR